MVEALRQTATLLALHSAVALEGAEGRRQVSLREIRENWNLYKQSEDPYLKLADGLQPHVERLFEKKVRS